MIDLNAALGIQQLKKINLMWRKRQKVYKKYVKELKSCHIALQQTSKYNYKHGYHLFLFVFDHKKFKIKNIRDRFLQFLNNKNIGGGVHYRSVTSMTNFKNLFRWNKNTCPISRQVGENIVSLPLYPGLTQKEQNYIIKNVKIFMDMYKKWNVRSVLI